MSDELVVAGPSALKGGDGKGDFSDYRPLEMNLGVFFSSKKGEDRSTLSLNYTRNYIKFDFSMICDNGQREYIGKRFTLTQGHLVAHALRAIIADRIATMQHHVANGSVGAPNYSVLPESAFEFNTHYFSKETKELVNNGKVTFSTVEIDGVNRVCVKGYSETGMLNIRVVLHDDANGENFHKSTGSTTIDVGDLDLYKLGLEIERALKSTFIYAGFDKIYQALKYKPASSEKKGLFGGGGSFFNRNAPKRQVSVNDSNSDESGADLFEQDANF
ncbi:MAG: hypothetical protein ACRC5M_04480 [Anaeroplasmataceae bacterium]